MEENNRNPSPAGGSGTAAAAQQQQLLLQQQLFIMQQQQHQQQQQQNQRPRSQIQQPNLQQAMSRFPSNIDAHLRSPGLRQFPQFQQNQLQQNQIPRSTTTPPPPPPVVRNPQIDLALQDAFKVCNPDTRTPFTSIEDAVNRLLPYHVVSDYEAEEDDRLLESDKTGQVPSRLQQWDHNILVKIAEFTSTFEKQVLAFNIMTRKRSHGEFRSEERLLLEQALIQEERRAAMEAKMEMEAREKAVRMAEMVGAPGSSRTAMRGHAVATQGEDVPDRGPWINNNNNNNNTNINENNNDGDNEGDVGEEGEEDFLNNEENGEDDENGDDDDDSDAEFDLNAR